MTAKSWLRVLLAGAAVLTLAGCSKADRAVMFAPGCPEGPAARPTQRELPPGTAWAWQAPYNAPAGSFTAGPVPGLTDVVSIADSGHTTVAVRADGTVWSYGTNVSGSLGRGSQERVYEAEPSQVTGIGGPAHAVYSSGPTFYVVLRDGTVTAWGSDRFLVKGGKREGYDGVTVPERVSRAENVVAMGPGLLNAFALRSDGRILGWGINLTDVLGDRDGTRIGTIPDVEGVVDVSSAGGAVVALKADGKVCAWGSNVHGLLGVAPTGGQSARPLQVEGLKNIEQVVGGSDVAYALDRDGTVRAWGRGAGGALGDGDTTDHVSANPTRVTGLPKIRRISATGLTGYAIDTEGGLWAWGSGIPLSQGTARPVRIPLPAPALDVSGHHAILLPK
ncbi:RCC1 repeat domain-containing protein [Streptomyces davaonensis JCM 4913]|uniref:RCC1 repeat domain-containing protein n=1 Tax=Streptomyces davaonensis (strain DSM 101723 / JCM 4913 / KCC S-0913 / 768) TaxID=1214101 RepID=K4R7D8_STRDJ|nr:chromosome condensation regulator [Streptomyces davaonensis]CCK29022.1 RCC1 repeat domain-containing protein [Streptomyces davaonensis JCM 4913]